MKRKKHVKMLGKRTHGYGSHKKHRGAGSKGGRGCAGSKKHKKTWILRYERGHLGKRGFKSLKQRNIKPVERAINLRNIEKLLEKGSMEIDLTELGYDKVLGSGEIEKPLVIKAKLFSKRAEEKIQKAGGKVARI